MHLLLCYPRRSHVAPTRLKRGHGNTAGTILAVAWAAALLATTWAETGEGGRLDPRAYIEKAVALIEAGDHALARAYLDPSVISHRLAAGERSRAYYLRGYSFYAQGHYISAAADYAHALEFNAGNPAALFAMGGLYRHGLGLKTDPQLAFQFFYKAAEREHAGARLYVGNAYLTGEGTATDLDEARHWLGKAAEAEFAPAMTRLASSYRKPHNETPDPEQARYWYERAAQAGSTDALVSLGYMYLNGELAGSAPEADALTPAQNGTSMPASIRRQRPSADADTSAEPLARIRHQLPAADADALALRGRAPSSRFDVLQSTPASSSGPRDQAGRRLDALTTKVGDGCGLAGERGRTRLADPASADQRERVLPGRMEYRDRRGRADSCHGPPGSVPAGIALDFFRKAAGQGSGPAMAMLGHAYMTGQTVQPDFELARRWYLQAAGLGAPGSFAGLGHLHEAGLGVPANPGIAERWYATGAEAGQTDALLRLLYLLAGSGRHAEAASWATRAFEAGDALTLNGYAWLLATSPHPDIRDGDQALAQAQRAVRLERKAAYLHTLAAAYAEIGRFEDAVAVLRQALARIRHQLPAADADSLALRGRAPSSRFDVLSSTPASSSGPCDQAGRRLDALTTKVGDGCGLAGNDPALAEKLEKHLAAYEKGRPWRE